MLGLPEMTEALAHKELAEEEEQRQLGGQVAVHETSPSAFLVMGLEIEETQYVQVTVLPTLTITNTLQTETSCGCQSEETLHRSPAVFHNGTP